MPPIGPDLVLALLTAMFPLATKSLRPDAANLCPMAEYIDDLDKTVTEFFECPGAEGNIETVA
jgi:hypothetical protein